MTLEEIKKRAESGSHCFLYRDALRNDWIDPNLIVQSLGMWHCRLLDDMTEQLRSWLCESLATALDHDDPLIRLRATLQAYEYTGRLRERDALDSRSCDALFEARNKLEAPIRGY